MKHVPISHNPPFCRNNSLLELYVTPQQSHLRAIIQQNSQYVNILAVARGVNGGLATMLGVIHDKRLLLQQGFNFPHTSSQDALRTKVLR